MESILETIIFVKVDFIVIKSEQGFPRLYVITNWLASARTFLLEGGLWKGKSDFWEEGKQQGDPDRLALPTWPQRRVLHLAKGVSCLKLQNSMPSLTSLRELQTDGCSPEQAEALIPHLGVLKQEALGLCTDFINGTSFHGLLLFICSQLITAHIS